MELESSKRSRFKNTDGSINTTVSAEHCKLLVFQYQHTQDRNNGATIGHGLGAVLNSIL